MKLANLPNLDKQHLLSAFNCEHCVSVSASITIQSNQCFLLLPSTLDYNLLQDRQPCVNPSLNVQNLTHSSSHIRDISSEMTQSMHHL